MTSKLFINLLSFTFLIFLLKPSLSSHAHLPYAHLLHAQSPQSIVDNSSPLHFVKNLIGIKKGYKAKGVLELKNYFSYLGYMHGGDYSNIFDNNLELALKWYQSFFNLERSGTLDNETINSLMEPRCGVSDIPNDQSQLDNNNPWMVSRYTFLSSNAKWPPTKSILTYSFQSDTRSDVIQPIVRATIQWANVTRFKFNYIKDYSKADIKISFQQRDHGDGSPFDGPNGVLAHSFGPPDGRLHYDAQEKWIDGVAPGYFDLQSIGLHELGHCLGLDHSTDKKSIMHAHFPPNMRKSLSQDDIEGVNAIYQN